MTQEEAKRWLDNVLSKNEARLIEILMEYDTLRSALCERTLLVATGADDWVSRSIRRAEVLSYAERALRKLINLGSVAIEDAKRDSYYRECGNCAGRKLVNGESCVCCHGTGVRRLTS